MGTGGSGGAGPSPSMRTSLSFGNVEQVLELSTEGKDDNPSLTEDQLMLCFTSQRAEGTGNVDIWCSERSSLLEPFSAPFEPVGINSDGFESSVALSLDGLTMWFGSSRDGGQGGVDIWTSHRASRGADFGAPVPEVALNSKFDEIPRPPGSNGTLFPISSRRQMDVYWTYLSEIRPDGSYAPPKLVEELAFSDRVLVDGHLSEDGLLLLFTMDPNGDDQGDIFAAERAGADEAFGPPMLVKGINGSSNDRDPWLSRDGRVLYFSSDRDGDFRHLPSHGPIGASQGIKATAQRSRPPTLRSKGRHLRAGRPRPHAH